MKYKEKLKRFLKSTTGKIAASVASATAVLAPASTAFCADDPDFISSVQSVWSQITSVINLGNIVKIIGICIAAVLGAFFFWFGIRYAFRKIKAATTKGKASV